MNQITRIATVLVIGFCVAQASSGSPGAAMQATFTLAGEWLVRSSPIDGKTSSPRGISLGFPDRDMLFEEQGNIRLGSVLREDVGENVTPLGVWRLIGNEFSATFQLWCPNTNGPCGSIVMRGKFVRDDKINGTMTAFFDVEDPNTPTGFDTFTFSFVGNRIGSGDTGGAN